MRKPESTNLVLGTQMYTPQTGYATPTSAMRETDAEEKKNSGVQRRAFCSDSFDPRDAQERLYTGPRHPLG